MFGRKKNRKLKVSVKSRSALRTLDADELAVASGGYGRKPTKACAGSAYDDPSTTDPYDDPNGGNA